MKLIRNTNTGGVHRPECEALAGWAERHDPKYVEEHTEDIEHTDPSIEKWDGCEHCAPPIGS